VLLYFCSISPLCQRPVLHFQSTQCRTGIRRTKWNNGPKCTGGKWRTNYKYWKMQDRKLQDWKMQDLKMQNQLMKFRTVKTIKEKCDKNFKLQNSAIGLWVTQPGLPSPWFRKITYRQKIPICRGGGGGSGDASPTLPLDPPLLFSSPPFP